MSKKFLIDINVDGDVTADGFKPNGGTSSDFLKGDGSLDSNSYLTTSQDAAILRNSGTPLLGTGITGGSIRTLIGAGTSSFSGSYNDLTNVPSTFTPSSHTHDDRYYTETEIDNKFSGAAAPSGYNKSNWDTAHGWGDHSLAGYLTSETDSQTLSVSGDQLSISNGNTVTLPDNNTQRTDEEIQDVVGTMLQAGNGITLDYDDANNELEIASEKMEQTVENNTGSTIAAGVPVYQTGVSGNNMTVAIADANNASAMPAVGITAESIANGATGKIVTSGLLKNINTSTYSVNEVLYISNSGTLTSTPPSGESSKLQNIARVIKSHASSGELLVTGAGRTNATPNLNNGNIFIGNGSNQAVSSSLDTEVSNLGYLKSVSGDWTGTFDGQEGSYYLNYNNLNNTPSIPTATSDLTNDSGFITDGNTNWNNSYGFITASSTDTLTNKSGNISQWTNDSGYISSVTGDWTGTFDGQQGTYYLDYNNFTNTPSLFSGSYNDLTNVPSTFAPSAHTLDSHSNVTITSNSSGEILKWNGTAWINNTLAEAGIAATGDVFSGAYADLTGKPTIPTATSDLSNDSGFITDGNTNWNNSYGFITASSTDTLTNKSGNISQWTNDSGYISSVTGDWTGTLDGQEGSYYLDYNNLTNKPTIPSNQTLSVTNNDISISGGNTITLYDQTLNTTDDVEFNDVTGDRIYLDPQATSGFQIGETLTTYAENTATSGNKAGIWNQIISEPTGASTSYVSGQVNMVKIEGSNSGGTVAAVDNYARFQGTNGLSGGLYANNGIASYRGTDPNSNNTTSTSLNGVYARSETQSGAGGNIEYMIGANIQSQMDATDVDVKYLQGAHIQAGISAGEVTDTVSVALLDMDQTGGTISGDFAYLRIQNDTVTATGDKRAINSLSTLPSKFAGTVQAEELISDTGVKMGDDSATAAASIAGTMRYRQTSSASYVEMVMKTGPGTGDSNYEWVEILRNEYPAI